MVIKRILPISIVLLLLTTLLALPCFAVTGGIVTPSANSTGTFDNVYKLQRWSTYTTYILDSDAGAYLPLPNFDTLWTTSGSTNVWTSSTLTTQIDNGYRIAYAYPTAENNSYDSVTGEQSLYMTYRPTLLWSPNENDDESNTLLLDGMFYTRRLESGLHVGFRFDAPYEGVTDCSISWAGRVYWRDSTKTHYFNAQNTSGYLEGPLNGQIGVDVALTDIIDLDTESYDDVVFVGTIVLTQDVNEGYVGITDYYTRGANAEQISYDSLSGELSTTNFQGYPKVVSLLLEDARNTAGGIDPSGTLNITENGVYNVTYYDNVNVNVPTEVIDGELPNMFEWLIDAGEAFLNFKIAPGWYLSTILTFLVILGLIIWAVRLFMGG